MNNVINAGGWYVGNTAILDWLDGFDEVGYIKGDLNICRQENGIMDILAVKAVDQKIEILKIIKKDCIFSSRIILKSFVGRYTKHFSKRVKPRPYNTSFRYYKDLYSFANRYIYFLTIKKNFDEYDYCQKWIYSLVLRRAQADTEIKTIVYQNPFFYKETFSGHEEVWPRLFNPYKLIFVHRDPLDQLFDIVNSGDHLLASWSRFHGDTSHLDPIGRFFEISKKIYTARIRMAEQYDRSKLLIFSFEDFLLKHELVKNRIIDFLNITSTRDVNNKRFVLKESLNNVGKGHSDKNIEKLLAGRDHVIDHLNSLRSELVELS
jgi:hypothetical protein